MIFFTKSNLLVFYFNLVNSLFTRCRLKISCFHRFDQGCPTFYLSRAKYSSASLPRAPIVAVIKVMFSCNLVRRFYVTSILRYGTLDQLLVFRHQNKCSLKKKKVLSLNQALVCNFRLQNYVFSKKRKKVYTLF